MTLGMEVGLGPVHIVLDGDTALFPKKGADPPNLKLVLGTAVGLSQGDFVLDGDLAPSPKRGRSPSPIFGPCLLWPNG